MSAKECANEDITILNGRIEYHDGPSYGRNPLNQMFFLPVFKLAFRVIFGGNLNHTDAWKLLDSQSAERNYLRLQKCWDERCHLKKYRLILSLLDAYWIHFTVCIFMQCIYIALTYSIPLLLPYFISYLRDGRNLDYMGYVYATAIFVSGFCSSSIFNLSTFFVWWLGIKIRASLITIIYRKSLNVSPRSINSGKIINMMSNDSQFILDTLCMFVFGICSPIQGLVCIAMLYKLIGIYCFIPPAILFVFIPVVYFITKYMQRYHYKAQDFGDERVKLIGEFISAIKIIKYYAWEIPFLDNLDRTREKQLSKLQSFARTRAGLMTILQSMPVISLGLTILIYSINHPINQDIYTVISYLISLRSIFIFTPLVLNFSVQYWTNLYRIQEFLLVPEIVPRKIKSSSSSKVIKIKNATLSYNSDPNVPPVLKNINLKVSKGKLIIFIGVVGSGKSSLMLSILNELELLKGEIQVFENIAYVSQEPFIIKATIRDNICFGQNYDKTWYDKVLNTCALDKDISLFPNGDLTELSEKGLNLSGGQRQRINLARAVYSRRSLYLMDDPFSALDSQVGDHVFKHVIKLLQDNKSTILLVSNLLNFLPFSDAVVVIKDGQIVENGKFSILLKNRGELFNLIEHIKCESETKKKIEKLTIDPPKDKSTNQNFTGEKILEYEDFIDKKSTSKKGIAKGVISKSVYNLYFKSASYSIFSFILFFCIMRIGLNFFQYIWISDWIRVPDNQISTKHIKVYAGIFSSELFFTILMCLINSIFIINGSRYIHHTLVKSISHASNAFYDRVPLGHILSVFTRDIGFVDTLLPWQLEYTLNILINLVTTFLILTLGSIWSILISLFGLLVFIIFMCTYRILASQGQRLEASSRASIFNQFSETLDGLISIRSYQMENNFIIQNYNNLNRNSVDFLTYRQFTQWFNLIVTQWLNFVVFFIFLSVVFLRNFNIQALDIELSLSSLSNTISLLMIAGAFSFSFFEFETRLNSIERVKNCTKIPQESAYQIPENTPPKSWPDRGEIIFDNIVASYRIGEPILKSISARIYPSEKIGVVGRTGAGKSTLITTLFRTMELDSGKIIVDDIDISKLGLFDLRYRLSIIPQVPQIFSGTVRYNLDPFCKFNDDELWKILKMVYLEDYILSLPNQLDEFISECGNKLSIGQSQLISMARCLLRKTKILLLDEATASLDSKTDFLVQKTIRKLFKNHTVITIAHRLITIIDSTRVMTLSNGQIAEFDTPKNLLLKKGLFWSMIQATGPEMAKHLEDVAFQRIKYDDLLLESIASLENTQTE